MIQTYSALLDQNNKVINISIGFQCNPEDFCPGSLVGTDCVLLVMIDGEIIFNNMPNIGDFFDEEINAFVPEKPDESYSLNENYEWSPNPNILYNINNDGKNYQYFPENNQWKLVDI